MRAPVFLLVAAAAAAAEGDEACSNAAGGECEELGFFQHSSKRKQTLSSHSSGNSTLQLFQWNVGHPKETETHSFDYVNSVLQTNAVAVDFFNVVNLNGLEVKGAFTALISDCGNTSVDSTTLIYNSQRWTLQGTPDKFCLSSGTAEGSDAAVVAKFQSTDGMKLVVVGAHFSTVTVFKGHKSAEFATLKERLAVPDGYDVVFLGDTNAFAWTSNKNLAEALGFAIGAHTPTDGATCCSPVWVNIPFTMGHWSADRIMTSLNATSTHVDIQNLAELVKPTPMGMHKPISLTLQI